MSGSGTLEIIIRASVLNIIFITLMRANNDIARMLTGYLLMFVGLIIILVAMGAKVVIKIKK